MMLGEAVIRRLTDDVEIARTTEGEIVEGCRLGGLPAITVQVIADPRPQHLKGFQRVRQSAVQVDVWGQVPADVGPLAERCIAVLTPAALIGDVRFQRATGVTVRSGGEPEQSGQPQRQRGELYRASIDFTFTHNAI